MKRGFGRFRVALFATIFLSLNPCPAADTKLGSLDDYLKRLGYFPIQLERQKHNQLVVEAALKGKKHVFLVDTGCSITIIDPDISTGLVQVDGHAVQVDDEFFKDAHYTNTVAIDELRMGGLQFQNQPALVRTVSMDLVATYEKGILGCDFFYRNHSIIDCARGRLYVHPGDVSSVAENALTTSLRQSKWTEAELTLAVGHSVLCTAKVNGKETRMVVDTGASFTMLDEEWAKTIPVKPLSEKRLDFSGVGKIGAHGAHEGFVDSFGIGTATFRNVRVGIIDLKPWGHTAGRKAKQNLQGLLGAETLAEIGAIIDFNSGELWFNPSSQVR